MERIISLSLGLIIFLVLGNGASAKPRATLVIDADILEGMCCVEEAKELPVLSADGKTLLALAENEENSVFLEQLQATTWGGIRKTYDFSDKEDTIVEREKAAKYLQRMISRRKFQGISLTQADSSGSVRKGDFIVTVQNGKLRFTKNNKLIYERNIKTRQSRGARLMGESAAARLRVDFVGAYIDLTNRVFVVSYGSGECDCACDLAPFYQLYRWDEK